jgi:hypothetical protein
MMLNQASILSSLSMHCGNLAYQLSRCNSKYIRRISRDRQSKSRASVDSSRYCAFTPWGSPYAHYVGQVLGGWWRHYHETMKLTVQWCVLDGVVGGGMTRQFCDVCLQPAGSALAVYCNLSQQQCLRDFITVICTWPAILVSDDCSCFLNMNTCYSFIIWRKVLSYTMHN